MDRKAWGKACNGGGGWWCRSVFRPKGYVQPSMIFCWVVWCLKKSGFGSTWNSTEATPGQVRGGQAPGDSMLAEER